MLVRACTGGGAATRSAATVAAPAPLLGVMNVGRQVAPLGSAAMAEFDAATPHVNAIARATPGHVWSFDNDANASARATVPELVADELLMPQLSVWTCLRSLRHFAFKSGHAMYFKRRRQWFEEQPDGGGQAVLWWFGAEEPMPSMVAAFERWRHLQTHGPTSRAFSLRTARRFPPPRSA